MGHKHIPIEGYFSPSRMNCQRKRRKRSSEVIPICKDRINPQFLGLHSSTTVEKGSVAGGQRGLPSGSTPWEPKSEGATGSMGHIAK